MLRWAWTHGSLLSQSGRRGGLCSGEAAAGSGHVLGLHMMLPCRNCMRPLCQGGKETYHTVSLAPSLVLSIIWTSFVQFPFYWSQFVVDSRSKSALQPALFIWYSASDGSM